MRLINGQEVDISIKSEAAKAHFANPYNYTKEILEEWEQQPFNKFIHKGAKIFLDIGANIGLFALHIIPMVKKIVCVEPTPEHMAINKEINPTAIHEQAALNNYTGETSFFRCGINTTMNSLDHQNRGEEFKTPCYTLSDLCKKHNLTKVDFCKIDIEGSEFKALTLETVLEAFLIINKYLIELHPRTRESQDHFKSIFEQAGYKVEYYDFNGSIYCHK